MAVEITMPQLSDTMSEGTILTWLKQEGDTVKRGEALAEVATDKADLEIESFHSGTLLKIMAPKGTVVKVGSVIAVVGEAGAAESAPQQTAPQQTAPQQANTQQSVPQAAAPQQPSAAQAAPAAAPQAVAQQPVMQQQAAPTASQQQVPQFSQQMASQSNPPPVPQSTPNSMSSSASQSSDARAPQANGYAGPSESREHESERLKISPLARNLASNLGVDVASLSGTGDGGRIVKRDIEKAAGAGGSSAQSQNAGEQAVPMSSRSFDAPSQAERPQPLRQDGPPATEQLSRMRQAIAARMVESTTSIPHFYVTSKIHVDALSKMRQSLKPLPQYEGLTYNHLIVKAAATALRVVPRVNASFQNNSMVQPQSVNVGIVTAVPDGLLIPVLKSADQTALADIVAEGRALVQRARAGRPKPDDLVGGTFSISNMGMFGVESFTAIISPGQGAILAVSPIQEEAIVVEGQVKVGSVLRVTLSVDHRIIDGVIAGEFLTELKRLLEDPVLLLA